MVARRGYSGRITGRKASAVTLAMADEENLEKTAFCETNSPVKMPDYKYLERWGSER